MKRLFVSTLLVLSLGGALVLVGVTWSQRADEICRKQAPQSASDYSMSWEWSEVAYVCDYPKNSEEPKRVGIIDAFHSDGRRHGSNR